MTTEEWETWCDMFCRDLSASQLLNTLSLDFKIKPTESGNLKIKYKGNTALCQFEVQAISKTVETLKLLAGDK